MNFVQIPLPTFDFEAVIKLKANEIIQKNISTNTIAFRPSRGLIEETITTKLYEFVDVNQKLVFINEFIVCIAKLKNEFNESKVYSQTKNKYLIEKEVSEHNDRLSRYDSLLFYLYNLLSRNGYNLDKNTFTSIEMSTLDSTIDSVLNKITEIQLGQQVIFDHIDEVKDDFISSKADYPLGKKRWYQRIGGIVLSFAGDKGGDELWTILRPDLVELLKNFPHYIEKIQKMISH